MLIVYCHPKHQYINIQTFDELIVKRVSHPLEVQKREAKQLS